MVDSVQSYLSFVVSGQSPHLAKFDCSYRLCQNHVGIFWSPDSDWGCFRSCAISSSLGAPFWMYLSVPSLSLGFLNVSLVLFSRAMFLTISSDQIWHSNSSREQACFYGRTWSHNFGMRPKFLDSNRLGLAIVPLCRGTGAPLRRTQAPTGPFEFFW